MAKPSSPIVEARAQVARVHADGARRSRANSKAVAKLVDEGREDAWFNPRTGSGTDYDKATAHRFVSSVYLHDGTLAGLFGEDPFAERICCAHAEEALKRSFGVGIELGDEPELDELDEVLDLGSEVREYLDGWQIDEHSGEGQIWARTFGNGVAFIGADDGRGFDQPLDEENVRGIDFIRVYDRRQLTPKDWYRGLSANSGQVEAYYLHPVNEPATDAVVHASRLVVFRGARTEAYQRARLNGWDDSVLRRCYEIILSASQNWQAICHLMSDLSQAVFGIKGLSMMTKGPARAVIDERLAQIDRNRSTSRAVGIDADKESFTRTSSQLAGLAELDGRTVLRVAMCAHMPVVVLMGQAPAGFDATGASDFQGWYDSVERYQRQRLTPPLRRMVRLALLSKRSPVQGEIPRRLAIRWPALWQGTTKDRALEMEAIAKRDALAVQGGIVYPHEIAESRYPRAGGWSPETVLDRKLRRELREIIRQRILHEARTGPPVKPSAPQRPQSPEVGTTEPVGAGAGGETDPMRSDDGRVIRNG